ncbi:MAG: Hsp20/alpha crystallin family protein [Desulfovibrionaceae bacterium]|nr:Hsp20/alpha crystallin family protein [Desulfovibrionaceae bacterium]
MEPCMTCVRPMADVVETGEGFHVYMDMPGVGRDGLAVDLANDEVTVRGKSGYAPRADAGSVHAEFGPVEYARSFAVSDAVNREAITASIRDGVLDLFLPKADEVKPRRIEITG